MCIWPNMFVFHFAPYSMYNLLFYDVDCLAGEEEVVNVEARHHAVIGGVKADGNVVGPGVVP